MEDTFGTRLAEALRWNNFTQEGFAEKIDVSGQMVWRYCNDAAYPKVEKLIKICKALDVSADWLLGLET